VFPGGFNWPLWAADEKRFFAREGLDVTLTPTASSAFQIANVVAGKFDIAMTAVDNVIACREGQVEAVEAAACDLFAFMGGDSGLLSLFVQPETGSYSDLRGKALSVDAPTTGYAFVLRALLERGGLKDGDYTLTPAGGVLQRWEALQARRHAGTLLLTPFDLMAESAGFRRLANALDVLGSYQGLVGAARRAWASAHPTSLVGFIRAYRAGLTWLFDRANRHEALALLQKFVPGMSPALAARAYHVLLAPSGGFHPAGAIDLKGVETVIQLRGRYALPRKALADAARYYDATYYDQASRAR
jgi:ABC-type nitrate/sulfonate/bicarbonate transport system substrate-binding protein